MSEAIRTETAHPRRSVRSVAAVLAGIVVDVLLTIGTDLALHAARVFPPWGQPMIRADALAPKNALMSTNGALPRWSCSHRISAKGYL